MLENLHGIDNGYLLVEYWPQLGKNPTAHAVEPGVDRISYWCSTINLCLRIGVVTTNTKLTAVRMGFGLSSQAQILKRSLTRIIRSFGRNAEYA